MFGKIKTIANLKPAILYLRQNRLSSHPEVLVDKQVLSLLAFPAGWAGASEKL